MSTRRLTDVQRFWLKVSKTHSCWNWMGCRNALGYGFFYTNKHTVSAHRFSYELLKDKIPKNMIIDHLCRNRSCVNPEHMEVVTQRENVLRGLTIPAINSKKTQCVHGHSYTPQNTFYRKVSGKRECRTCQQLRCKKYKQQQKRRFISLD